MRHPTLQVRHAVLAQRARFAVLAVIGLFVGHTVVFAAQWGAGPSFSEAMTAGGHDGYWFVFMLAATTGGVVLALRTGVRLWSLRDDPRRRRVASGRMAALPVSVPSYAGVFRGLGGRLVPTLLLGYLLQENLEHLSSHGHLIGLGALSGPENPVALPVLTLVALGLAAIGALVRWRIATLEAQRAATTVHRLRARGLDADRPSIAWSIRPAARSVILLPRLGRAPPLSSGS